MTQAIEKKTYTPEEYLELEVVSEERHEYINGEIRLMTGGTPNHNKISSNLLIILKLALRKRPYEIFIADRRLWLQEPDIYTYPDIMVLEQPIQLQERRTDTVMNPCLIAEVLSKSSEITGRSTFGGNLQQRDSSRRGNLAESRAQTTPTKDYDRSDKFITYRTMEAFQEYLLIDQYKIHVEHYVKRAANQWLLSEYKDPEVILNLSSVDVQLKIADLYENIEFVDV